METLPPKTARRAAVMLRVFADNFDGETVSASIVKRLGKLDLKAVAAVLDRVETVLDRTAPERLQVRIEELESSLKRLSVTQPRSAKPSRIDPTPGGDGGGFRRPYYMQRFPARVCMHCRKYFLAARPDAKTCSPKCRVAYHRKLKAKPELAAEHAGKVADAVIPSGPYIGKRKPRPGPMSAYKAERVAAYTEESPLPANISDGERKRFEQIKANRNRKGPKL